MGQDSERLARSGVGDCCFRKPLRRICAMSIHVILSASLLFLSLGRIGRPLTSKEPVMSRIDIEIADDLSAWAHERGERAAATC